MINKKFATALLLFCAAITAAYSENIYHEQWIDFNKNGRMDIYENPSAPLDERIQDLMSQMTLDEKTGQMVTLYGWGRVLKDEYPTPGWKSASWKDGIANIDEHGSRNGRHTEPTDHVEYIRAHQRWFVEETRLGIPVDFSNEGIRGLCHDYCTTFPDQLARGATFDRDLEYKIAKTVAEEARALGYSNIYSPILDVLQDPRWGRARETYGESPYLVGEMGLQHVRGIQDQKIVSTPKHFAVYSAPYGGNDAVRGDCQIPFRTMHEVFLEPFRKAFMEAKALGTMSSYSIYDGDSVTGSRYFLTDLLRNTYGFKGYVVSDSGAVRYIQIAHSQVNSWKEAVAKAVNAGLNVRTAFRPPEDYLVPLREAIRDGLITEQTVNERVRDVLYVKFWMGLFDNPYIGLDDAPQRVRTEESKQLALRAAQESIVLLRNRQKILPLEAGKYKKILVCGPAADHADILLGHYGPSQADVVTPLASIRAAFEGLAGVEYAQGCPFAGEQFPASDILRNYVPSNQETEQIDEAVRKAQDSDLIIACMGDCPGLTVGENVSRTDLTLPRIQEYFLQKLADTGKPVVLVLMNGRPVILNDAQDKVPAILNAFIGGEAAGTAIADCLIGKYNPGGRMPYTTPRTVGQLPLSIPYRQFSWKSGKAYASGPLFYFGYGLSYTTFAYDNLQIRTEGCGETAVVTVSFDVKNTGPRGGDTVPQLYVEDKIASVSPLKRQLRGFDRVSLQPGETRQVEMQLHTGRDLKIMNIENSWAVEPGDFSILIAESYRESDIQLKDRLTFAPDGTWRASALQNDKSEDLLTPVGKNPATKQNPLKNLTDNDPETHWSSKEENPALTFRCGMDFNQIEFLWYKGEERSYPFEILVSDDLDDWTEIYRGVSRKTQFMEAYELPPVSSKYLRIQFHGSDSGRNTSICELIVSEKIQ